MKIMAIIQARMSSDRFPGKTLHQVNGKPMLQYLLERVKRCHNLDGLVVATSVEESDSPVEMFCKDYGVMCFRGSLNDVAGRFIDVLANYPCDAFVRVNGDSPLMDPQLIDLGVNLFRQGDFDIVTNIYPRSFPKGQSVEVLRFSSFCRDYEKMVNDDEHEHITRYFYNHPDLIRIHNFSSGTDSGGIQLSVDTLSDMVNFERIINNMDRPHWEYSWFDILSIMNSLQTN